MWGICFIQASFFLQGFSFGKWANFEVHMSYPGDWTWWSLVVPSNSCNSMTLWSGERETNGEIGWQGEVSSSIIFHIQLLLWGSLQGSAGAQLCCWHFLGCMSLQREVKRKYDSCAKLISNPVTSHGHLCRGDIEDDRVSRRTSPMLLWAPVSYCLQLLPLPYLSTRYITYQTRKLVAVSLHVKISFLHLSREV